MCAIATISRLNPSPNEQYENARQKRTLAYNYRKFIRKFIPTKTFRVRARFIKFCEYLSQPSAAAHAACLTTMYIYFIHLFMHSCTLCSVLAENDLCSDTHIHMRNSFGGWYGLLIEKIGKVARVVHGENDGRFSNLRRKCL